MMRVLPLLLLCSAAYAAEVRLPSLSRPAFVDTESVTNAPLGRALETSRFLRVRIELTATPSNNVEVAFGTEEGSELPFGSEAFAVGWDCGAWFIASPTNRIEGATCTNAAPRTLFFEVRVAEDGTPRAWTVATSGGGSFANLPAVPPDWTFSRDWTTVRLVVRGVDERDESVSVHLDTDPGVLILR
jgi:hypothetical protein